MTLTRKELARLYLNIIAQSASDAEFESGKRNNIRDIQTIIDNGYYSAKKIFANREEWDTIILELEYTITITTILNNRHQLGSRVDVITLDTDLPNLFQRSDSLVFWYKLGFISGCLEVMYKERYRIICIMSYFMDNIFGILTIIPLIYEEQLYIEDYNAGPL
jgi:hypothetical protein